MSDKLQFVVMCNFPSPSRGNLGTDKLKFVEQLPHADAVVTIHRRSVGNNDLIALFEPAKYLDGAYGAAAQHYLGAQSFLSIRIQAK
jgi:hypothetical protein